MSFDGTYFQITSCRFFSFFLRGCTFSPPLSPPHTQETHVLNPYGGGGDKRPINCTFSMFLLVSQSRSRAGRRVLRLSSSPTSPPFFVLRLCVDLTPATPTCTHACTPHRHTCHARTPRTHPTPLRGYRSSSSSSTYCPASTATTSTTATTGSGPVCLPAHRPPRACTHAQHARYAWHTTRMPHARAYHRLLPPPRAAGPNDHCPSEYMISQMSLEKGPQLSKSC